MPRPKPIDERQLLELARLNVTQGEAAAVLGVSLSSLSHRLAREPYKSLWAQGTAESRVNLRRKMYDMAMSGSVPCVIFLAKQKSWLGFSDHKETTVTAEINTTTRYVAEFGVAPGQLGASDPPQFANPASGRLALPPGPEDDRADDDRDAADDDHAADCADDHDDHHIDERPPDEP